MLEQLCIKQMIVITDGCSNQGESPASAAAAACKAGITVNAVGLLHKGFDENARKEIEAIAQAGEGIADFTNLPDLSYSMQALTHASMQMTVEKALQRQLVSIVGTGGLASIPPQARGKIVDLWENVCESATLKCLLLIDCSGSMRPKLAQAAQSMRELLVSLQGRKGQSLLGVTAFPGNNGGVCRLVTGFTADLSAMNNILAGIQAAGVTPTGPAIREAIGLLTDQSEAVVNEYVV